MTSQKKFYTIICLIYSWNVSSMVINTVLSVREIYLLYFNSKIKEQVICICSVDSLQHQQHEQHINEAKNCSKKSRSSVHVELQAYHFDRNAILTNE